jgi:plastocyanin
MPGIDFSSNPQCERGHRGKPVHAETVVVNPNGTLANTLVWISGGLPQGRWEPPAPSVKLDQSGCVYKPHVLALMTGQDLEVFNSDPVNHNVHAEASVNPATNDMEPPRAETIHKRFSQQEIWIPFTCSVHPWMRAYVAVISHPFFAVTGADGSFQIAGVPPGKYTLETVHEKYGRKTTEITVSARQNGQADFEYGE